MFETLVFYALLALLPTQFAYHFWPASSFVYGIRVDYLAPTIYLTDILVVLLFFLSRARVRIKLLSKTSVLLGLFILLNIYFSVNRLAGVYKWFKVLELIFLAFYVSKLRPKTKIKKMVKILFYSATLVSVIGILQFIKGSTLGFPFNFLGERTFNLSTPGIALVQIFGIDYLRAYSVFSHPNSLAGFLAVIVFLLFVFKAWQKSLINILSLFLVAVCFLLTFSFSAYFSLLLVSLFYLIFKKRKFFWKTSLLTVFLLMFIGISSPVFVSGFLKNMPNLPSNMSQRLELIKSSGQILRGAPFFGVGLNSFISANHFYWLLQPVHNIFLLILVEAGIIGAVVFSLLLLKVFLKLKKRNLRKLFLVFLFILLTGSIDHYWVTLQQNMLLLSVFCGTLIVWKDKH